MILLAITILAWLTITTITIALCKMAAKADRDERVNR